MADGEDDFSQLPLSDQFIHKNWKARKGGYEAATKAFDVAQTENDPLVRQFVSDSGIWKGVVADSNVAAQQEGLAALCSFLQIAGKDGCTRTRKETIAPIVEKGLTGRPAAKQRAQEAILLYIELDKADPIIEELLALLSHKQPKVIAATLGALTAAYHAYGCKTIDPKQTLKVLPKVYGHADKNVRAAAQELTVEFYRWLKDSMKPLFWNDLKPVQQQDLDKLFEKVKDEPTPRQERLLRTQQAAPPPAAAVAGPGGGDEGYEDELPEEAEDLELAVDVMPKVPKDFEERLGSSKWKDRKEALDELHTAINVQKMEEGPFDNIMRGLAKSMKDANIAVVTVAANCIELFGRGLRRSFAKYRSTVMGPMMERLKEKKQAVADAIGSALDAVFASTSFNDCLEEILEFLKHKNPQVKLESTKFLIRCLKSTKAAPELAQVKSIADASTKLLTESQEVQRNAGAEVLGTLWKIMGDRIMNAHLEGLDEIRKTKIKEYHDAAEVKAKYKPKAAVPPKPAPAAAGKRPVGKKPMAKKPTPAAAPPAEDTAPLAPKPTSRPGVSKLGPPKSGLTAPSGLRAPGLAKKAPGLPLPGTSTASPKRQGFIGAPATRELSPEEEDYAPPAAPKFGLGRGLAGRPLGKPAVSEAPPPPVVSGLAAADRAELDELRMEVERLRKQTEDLRSDRTRLSSQIHELQNQNAQLIEDHTRDVLSIKAKETQLVRARSDADAAEQLVATQQREVDRLKRELSRQIRATSPAPYDASEQILSDTGMNGSVGGRFGDSGYEGAAVGRYRASRTYGGAGAASPGGEGKENFSDGRSSKLSPLRGSGSGFRASASISSSSGGRASPADMGASTNGAESWKRAAEVTQNLKERIALMKAKQAARNQGQ
ncbi:ARM repeat-containing protein [Pseudovirgaria hyperparasitica]|uniref:ARM repeat-containing protein n=1 Tax=Pseudovirgaria hyperparasitica TaxID=470096 RepID=A0A6A6VXI1_9PEZI|nr:ARM repeat-containing protein [Pseudovirgaria hyperparasitica]KAF2754933.1 ARM repeat-containing protein [Pseudovirgaria hyperparasitica]